MKKSICSSLAFIGLLFIWSCSKKPNLIVNSIEVDYSNKSVEEIRGKLLKTELLGAMDLFYMDSLLCFTTSDGKAQLVVMNNRLDTIGKFCQRGRANNEFIDVSTISYQIYRRNGHIILPLANNYEQIKEVDLTESLKQGKTVIGEVDFCEPTYEVLTTILDENIKNRFEMLLNKYGAEDINRVPCLYSLKYPDRRAKEFKVFRRLVEVEDESYILVPYGSELIKHPSKNIVVNTFMNMDYILFFNLDEGKKFAIHKSGSPTFDDLYLYDSEYTFQGGCSSNKYVMMLYYHGKESMKEPDKMARKAELVVFDWEGNFINNIKLDRRLCSIGFDEINNKLFALSFGEELYEYDLSNVLP